MKNWLNYHHLYYFKAVAEEGSVSKAAEKLSIGQPTLSTQIKQFEDSLGVALFNREGNRLSLNEFGEIVFAYAESIFQMGEEMQAVLRGERLTGVHQLKIGSLHSIPRQILSRMVRFARTKNDCTVHLVEGTSSDLIEKLNTHQLDLVLTTFLPTGEDSKGVNAKLLSKTPVSFYGAPQEGHLKEGFPKSIKGYPLVMPTYDSKLRYDIDQWLSTNKIDTKIVVESQDISVKKFIAMEDLGILPAASHTVTRHLLSGELVEIGPLDGVYEELFLLSASRKISNKIASFVFDRFRV